MSLLVDAQNLSVESKNYLNRFEVHQDWQDLVDSIHSLRMGFECLLAELSLNRTSHCKCKEDKG